MLMGNARPIKVRRHDGRVRSLKADASPDLKRQPQGRTHPLLRVSLDAFLLHEYLFGNKRQVRIRTRGNLAFHHDDAERQDAVLALQPRLEGLPLRITDLN